MATASRQRIRIIYIGTWLCSKSFVCTDVDSSRTVSRAGIKEMGSLLGLMLQREGEKPVVPTTGEETL